MKGCPWEAKKCKTKDSRIGHASTTRSFWSLMHCNRAHEHMTGTNVPPLKSTCKYFWSTIIKHSIIFGKYSCGSR